MLFDWGIRTLSSVALAFTGAGVGLLAQAIDPSNIQITLTLPTMLSIIGGIGGIVLWFWRDRQGVIDRLEVLEDNAKRRDQDIADLKHDVKADLLKGDRIFDALQELSRKGHREA